MTLLKDTYPIFEANQVLTNHHLNQEFEYLDEQERLTRTHLTGIGIVCGLEISTVEKTQIHLTKGCGVTSQGYLLIQPEDVTLVRYKKYIVPTNLAYEPFFKDDNLDKVNDYGYTFWELFEAGEPDATLLTPQFLQDKAVLLFLELKKDDLRNCSPNSCADRGAEVKATVRKLLVSRTDLQKIVQGGKGMLTPADIQAQLQARLKLADLRLPRYNVPNTFPVSSESVLSAFFEVFHLSKLSATTAKALDEVYKVFKPLLEKAYPTSPFTTFSASFGFLDTKPVSTGQVRFLQYYYDMFDDLIKAYDEFRWKGLDLMCTCCPDEDLFPRHLILGLLFPLPEESPELFRHEFMPSPALSGCEGRTEEVLQLFRRLVEMTKQFHNPYTMKQAATEEPIRITPSKLADVPLSDKAIPYYYRQTGTPPLYQLWNVEKTRRARANQNLGYRAIDTYAVANFVKQPLLYDLEPYNFLRVEGHLGKDVQKVLQNLLDFKSQYRLPIDIVALRTGFFDENMSLDLKRESAKFEDLETLFDTLREELLSTLCEGMMYFYSMKISESSAPDKAPEHPLLKKYAPSGYTFKSGTVGAWYEQYLTLMKTKEYVDIDPTVIETDLSIWTLYCSLFNGTVAPPAEFYPHVISVYYLSKLSEILTPDFNQLDFTDFENKYLDLLLMVRFFRSNAAKQIPAQFQPFIPTEDLIDHFDQVLFSCKLEPIRSLQEEYTRRIRELKKQQFLSVFLEKNPGIQHKAGVPMGGTFILVYHDDPDIPRPKPLDTPGRGTAVEAIPNTASKQASWGSTVETPQSKEIYGNLVHQIQNDAVLMQDNNVLNLINLLTGRDIFIVDTPFFGPGFTAEMRDIFIKTVNELTDGTVIADFYLPYLCCSDCSPVQFVLPTPPLNFTTKILCPNTEGKAPVKITPLGGQEPYTVKVDGKFQALADLLLSAGSHTIAVIDGKGTESAVQTIVVPERLTLVNERYETVERTGNQLYYTAKFDIQGGAPPFTLLSGGEIKENNGVYSFTSPKMPSGGQELVKIADANGCPVEKSYTCVCPDFTVLPFCTDPVSKQATAKLNITAGAAPFKYKLNNATSFTDLPAAGLKLPPGNYTIIILDNKQVQSLPVSIQVNDPIAILNYKAPVTGPILNRVYVVEFDIIGGKPPYDIDPRLGTIQLSLNKPPHFISKTIKCPQTFTVVITDSVKCSFSSTFSPCIQKEDPHTNPKSEVNIVRSASGGTVLNFKTTPGASDVYYKLNDEEYKKVEDRIPVGPGTHTLIFKNEEGIESEPQKFTIPASDLTPGDPSFGSVEMEDGTVAHTVSFDVHSGKPPYKADGGTIDGIHFTSDPVPKGEFVQVTITDSAGDAFSQPFHHEFIAPAPDFKVRLEATNPGNEALTTLTPTAGVAPFEFKVDNGEYKPLTGPFQLHAGTHTITIRDINGGESDAQEVTVPEYVPLSFGQETCDCKKVPGSDQIMYTVAFDILGGTAPYKSANGQINGTHFTSPLIAKGQKIEVTITDAVGGHISKTFQCDCPDVPKPAFTASLEATKPNNEAQTILTPTAGVSPFEFKADNGEYKPLNGPFPLHAGVHTVTIRDINGSESDAQEVTVPPYLPLVIGQEIYDCQQAPPSNQTMYTVAFDILGGMAPYTTENGRIDDKRFTSNPIARGRKTEITISDSVGGRVSKTFQHDCPVPKPAFTVDLDLTTPGNEAQVVLKPTAGIKPFEFKVDNKEYNALNGPFLLHAGTHTIVIRDLNVSESEPQEVKVPEYLALSFGPEIYDCSQQDDRGRAAYLVAFDIQGGTAPYQSKEGNIQGSHFISKSVFHRAELKVTITDSAGNTVTKSFNHQCENIPSPVFAVSIGCTGEDGRAPVSVEFHKGVPPIYILVDEALVNPNNQLMLTAGEHTVQVIDANEVPSAPQVIVIPDAMDFSAPAFECLADQPGIRSRYVVTLNIRGGVPPYRTENGEIKGNVFSSLPVVNSEALVVKVTDSAGCQMTRTYRHECPPAAKPAFSLTPACTDANGIALVKTDIQSGVRPYQMKVDAQDFKPLSNPLSMSAGKHVVILRDANGAESDPLEIIIPDQLTLLLTEQFECITDPAGKQLYTAHLEIKGGKPPYQSEKGMVEGSQYTSHPTATGEPLTVAITDAAGCRATKTLQYKCPLPTPVFALTAACPNEKGLAQLKFDIRQGIGPYYFSVDNQDFKPLIDAVFIPVGKHTVILRDANGADSDPQVITIPAPLTLSQEAYDCGKNESGQSFYTLSLDIHGGVPPYTANTGLIKGNHYISGPVTGGQSLEVTISDSVQCRVNRTFRHDCPAGTLTVHPNLGPTNAGNYAKLILKVEAGKAPFTYKINDQEHQPLTEVITLAAGPHTITVRDAAGVESAPLAIEVPKALAFGKEALECVALADGRQVYTVKFDITGGVPPFQATNGTVSGTKFESGQNASGSALNVEITDARGTRIERTFKKECLPDVKTCTLPCDGKAIRSGYRFWLAESSKNVPYTRYEINSAKFVFEGPDGRMIDLSRHFTLLIQATPENLNNNFAATVKGLMDKLNTVIAQAAGLKDWLRLDFTPSTNVRFPILWIEHFQCLSFDIQVNVSTTRLEAKEKYLFEYSPKGTSVTPVSAPMTELQAPFALLPFHRMEKNKCDELPGVVLEWIPIAKPFNLPLRIQKTVQGNEVVLQAQASELAKALLNTSISYLWEVADAAPILAIGEQARFKLLDTSPAEKTVRLIGFHQTGASVMTTDTINLSPIK